MAKKKQKEESKYKIGDEVFLYDKSFQDTFFVRREIVATVSGKFYTLEGYLGFTGNPISCHEDVLYDEEGIKKQFAEWITWKNES